MATYMPEPPPGPEGFPPGAIGGIPPELLGAAGPPGPPEEPGAPGGEPGSPVDMLRLLIDGIRDYMDVEPDDEDKATASKILAQLQGLLAKQQKEKDQAMGVGPAQRFLRRQA